MNVENLEKMILKISKYVINCLKDNNKFNKYDVKKHFRIVYKNVIENEIKGYVETRISHNMS
jgi:hypothetical protein